MAKKRKPGRPAISPKAKKVKISITIDKRVKDKIKSEKVNASDLSNRLLTKELFQ